MPTTARPQALSDPEHFVRVPLSADTFHTAALVGLLYENVISLTRRLAVLEKKYTEDHEWVELSPDGKTGIYWPTDHTNLGLRSQGTIGITNYAANQLGDVVYVELPQVDLSLKKGDSLGAVESVKSASDILTPVSGTVVEANPVLEEKPATINKGPEAEGWIAKVELADKGELDSLMDAKAYTSFTEESDSS